MEKLNKKQKQALKCLDEVYPASLQKKILLEKLGYVENEILSDIKLLEENKFVDLIYEISQTFPSVLTLTAKGKEKLKENFVTRLKESAYNNPWPAIAVIVTIVLGIVSANYYFQNIDLQKEKSLWKNHSL